MAESRHIFDMCRSGMCFQIHGSYQKTDRIMSFGTGKPQKEWNIKRVVNGAQFTRNDNSFWKFAEKFKYLSEMGENEKSNKYKKSGDSGFMEFPRPF